jgi:cytochrome c551/c552
MLKSVWISVVVVLLGLHCISDKSFAGNGEALFQSLKCGTCHRADQRAAAIPLKEIAEVYREQGTLVTYFKGESPAIIDSTKAGMMKGQLKNIQALSDEAKKVLADYIISFK